MIRSSARATSLGAVVTRRVQPAQKRAPWLVVGSLPLPQLESQPANSSVRSFHSSKATLYAADADITAGYGGEANVAHLARIARDFRTDTITMPTDAQVAFASSASRGDDVEGEDGATHALEARLAALAGKEAALLCVSSTMCNALSVRSHLTQPPHSIIADARAHTVKHEAGGAALFSQALTNAVTPANGLYLVREDVERALVLGTDMHTAPTRLVMLENTINGVVVPTDEMQRIADLAHEHGIPTHLDGARAWHVAANEVERRGLTLDGTPEGVDRALGSVLKDILGPFDSATLCLSKGLGAPIGSAIVGPSPLIARARWFRKAFGGGWRQSGHLAAQADWAVTHHFPRLAGTHALARDLAAGLQGVGCEILAPVDTNMVFFDPTPLGLTFDAVKSALGHLPEPIRLGSNRLVVHHQTSRPSVDDFVETVRRLAEEVPEDEARRVREGGRAEMGYR